MLIPMIFGFMSGCGRVLSCSAESFKKNTHVVRKIQFHTRTALRRLLSLCVCIGWLAPALAFAGVDLVVNTSDSPDPLPAGGVVTYTVTVANNGNVDATGVISSHSIPANLEYLGFSGAGINCTGMAVNSPGPGTLTCTHPDLENTTGESTLTVDLRTSAQGTLIFGATASSTEADDDPTNNTDDEQTTVNLGANVSISKTPVVDTVSAGAPFVWTLEVGNAGPHSATALRVEDPVPSGFNVTSLPAGCANNAGTIVCDITGPIAAGGTHLVGSISGVISAAGGSTVTNTATVDLGPTATVSDPADPDIADNTAISNISVTPGSDLRIGKTRSIAGNFTVGDSFNFILAPSYTGDSPTNITVTDVVPSNYTIGAVAASQNGWSCNVAGQIVTCTKPSGGIAGLNQPLGNITIPVTVASAGSNVANTASISAAGSSDPVPGNNQATDGGVNLLDPRIDLGVSKTGPNPALVVAGVPFNFTIRAANSGTTDFVGELVLTDTLPAGMTVTAYTLNGWSCSPAVPTTGPITCTRTYTSGAPLAAGASTPNVVMTATVNTTGTMSNSVSLMPNCDPAHIVDGCGESDLASYAVTSSVSTDSADISVLKTVDLPSVPAGDVLTYTLEIVNDGPTVSNNVVLNDTLQSLINNTVGATGAGYIGHTITPGSATGGACNTSASGGNGRQLTCNFTTIPLCTQGVDCPRVEVQVRPGGNGGSRVNSVNVVSNGTADPDHTNETASVTSNIEPRADITVTKNANPNSVPAGQNLTYVIATPNNGPSRADDVVITDILPLDVTFVSASPSAGSCSTTPGVNVTTTPANRTIGCNLGSVNNGAQQTVTVIVRPNTALYGTTITNDVSVATSTIETDASNNTATVNANVTEPALDLVLNKDDSVDPVAVGDNTVYTVTVNNAGPSAAENVVVTDTLPASGLSFQSVVSSSGSCPTQPAVDAVGGTIECALGNIPPGATRTVTVTMTALAKGVVTNNASVTSTETTLGYENASNNSVNETTTIRTRTDMQVVSKTPSANPVNLRDDFNFVIRVRNNTGSGLAEADGVVVSDTLPAGMQLTATPTINVVSGTTTQATCTGVAGNTSFTCSLGTVSLGAELDVVVPVQVVTVTSDGQVFSNRASVTTTSLDINGGSNPNGGNNFNDGTVTVNASSIDGRVFRDFEDNAVFDGADTGIAGISMTLTGVSFDGVAINRVVVTDANGNYVFPGLPQGTYTITEGTVSDPNLVDGSDTAGTAGGNTSVNDIISAINLPADTDATGYLFAEIPMPRIGLAKSAGAVTDNHDGTYDVQFSLTVANYGATPLQNVQVSDTIAIAGPQSLGIYTPNPVPAAGQYTIVGGPAVSNQINGASLTPVAAGVFTGSGAGSTLLVPATSNLPNFVAGNRSTATISFTVRFFPTTPGPFENTAIASGESPKGDPATDDSVDGLNPDPNGNGNPNDEESPTIINLSGQTIALAKRLVGVVQTGEKRFDIAYSLIVGNPGSITATNVQVTDDLVATFPTAQTRAIKTAPAVSACSGTVLNPNPAYNGTGQKALLIGNQPLLAGEHCTITFTADIDFGSNALPGVVQNNQAVATTAEVPGGTVIATDLSDDGTDFDANNNGNGNEPGENDPTPVDFTAGGLSSISGKVWFDANHDRIDNDGPENRVSGFIVEVLNGNGQIVSRTVTSDDGSYHVPNLYPSNGAPDSLYSVRFRDPVNGRIYGMPVPQDPDPTHNGTVVNGEIAEIHLNPSDNVVEQNLPLDPSGVIYNAVTRVPVSGARVTLLFGGTAVPGACLVGGQNEHDTGINGIYQFLLAVPPPPGCPGDGVYTIQVKQPAGYLPPASNIIPPTSGPHAPVGLPGGVEAIQVQAGPPTGSNPTTYYFSFNLVVGAAGVGVVHNHIPLDPSPVDAFFVSKTGNKTIVELGDTLMYTVQARLLNGLALASAQLVDNLPAGFRYIPGSATIAKGGAAAVALADPAGSPGPRLTFEIGAFDSNNPVVVTYRVRAGVGALQGDGINRVQGRSGTIQSNIARYKVKVTGGVFTDLACVAGKVFVDCNGNQIQDAEEVGVPGVRIYMEDGTYFISDVEGKYSYCGITPRTHVLKVDALTLPRGSRLTVTSNRNVGDANSIFLDVKNGELIRADFAEGSCSNTVMEQVKARRNQGEVRAPETEKRGAPALKFEGKAHDYPQQGTDSANQILLKPRGGGGDAPAAESVNNEPVTDLPASSGNTRGNNLRDRKGEANVR